MVKEGAEVTDAWCCDAVMCISAACGWSRRSGAVHGVVRMHEGRCVWRCGVPCRVAWRAVCFHASAMANASSSRAAPVPAGKKKAGPMVRVGIEMDDSVSVTHSWVERDGVTLLDTTLSSFDLDGNVIAVKKEDVNAQLVR